MRYALAAICALSLFAFRPDATPKPNVAIVNQYDGLYVFNDCVPAAQYDSIGYVRRRSPFKPEPFSSKSDYQRYRDKLINTCKSEYPGANGIIICMDYLHMDQMYGLTIKIK